MASHAVTSNGKSPITQFPYKLEDLHWSVDRRSNDEGVYCYCGKDKGVDEPMLRCQKCQQLFHSGCVHSLTKPLLKGDEFFKFECSVCTQGPEFFERSPLSWVILVHLVLYNLMDANPGQTYFRWKEEICKFIYDYWSYLLPEKEQSPTWNNTVASVLSVQNHIFLSGVEIKGASELKPKSKAQKSGAPRQATSKKEKRPRAKGSPSKKKTRFDETSSDDDFHTSAKPRPQASAPTTRIKSKQFSLSSGSSLSSAGDSDSDDSDAFWDSEEEERKTRPMVFLHGIPACIHHHFNPSGLDFSSGPIELEHLFRLADLIEDDSPGKLIHRVRAAINSVGGTLHLGGKKNQRKPSIVDVKTEHVHQSVHKHHHRHVHDRDASDITNSSSEDRSDDSASDSDNSDDSDDSDDSEDSDDDDGYSHGRAMAAKRTEAKRFGHSAPDRGYSAAAPPTSGGKYGRRKSSLKDPREVHRQSKKNVSMSDEPASYHSSPFPTLTARPGGGKKFSQAHLNAMAKANSAKKQTDGTVTNATTNESNSKAAARTKAKPKPKVKATAQQVGGTTSLSQQGATKPGNQTQMSSAATVKAAPPALTLQQLQRQQEWHILQVLEDASKSKALPSIAARFKRKLHLKRLKAFLHLPLFDMEAYMRQHLASPLDLTPLSKHIPPDPYELRRQRQEEFQAKIQKIDHTPYGNSFASRLLGQPVNCLTRKPWEPVWKSPFSGMVLKDYIWRDYESRSTMMDVLDEIRRRQGRPAKAKWSSYDLSSGHTRATAGTKRKRGMLRERSETSQDELEREGESMESSEQEDKDAMARLGDDMATLYMDQTPIDYCYFRKEHLAQVNETLCRRFWPGIDMTEALQYPEFSVVVLYKRLVVGCAFMTPEGYITYVAVSAGWEKAGIGQFMLYHLMQAANGKDITLHVSANNPAMIMYQKFGFKPEQFLVNFYKEYLPEDSTMCHNAFFVRLRR
ncbi:Cysteine-rich protein 2-binding protein [Podila epigama]|nr:Cysteine-rich protein 2-binding protein [Podila epigama]